MNKLSEKIDILEDDMAIEAMISCICAAVCNNIFSGDLDSLEDEIIDVLKTVNDCISCSDKFTNNEIKRWRRYAKRALSRIICLRYDYISRKYDHSIIKIYRKIIVFLN